MFWLRFSTCVRWAYVKFTKLGRRLCRSHHDEKRPRKASLWVLAFHQETRPQKRWQVQRVTPWEGRREQSLVGSYYNELWVLRTIASTVKLFPRQRFLQVSKGLWVRHCEAGVQSSSLRSCGYQCSRRVGRTNRILECELLYRSVQAWSFT